MTPNATANRLRLDRAAPLREAFVHQSLCTRVVFRPGAVQELGSRRPLLLTGTRTAAGALYASARAGVAHLAVRESGGIPQHSSVAAVSEVARLARDHDADALIAVGGDRLSLAIDGIGTLGHFITGPATVAARS